MSIRSKLFATVALPVFVASLAVQPALADSLMAPFEVAQEGTEQPSPEDLLLLKKRKQRAAEEESQGQAQEQQPQAEEQETPRRKKRQQQAEEQQPAAEESAPQQAEEQETPRRKKRQQFTTGLVGSRTKRVSQYITMFCVPGIPEPVLLCIFAHETPLFIHFTNECDISMGNGC